MTLKERMKEILPESDLEALGSVYAIEGEEIVRAILERTGPHDTIIETGTMNGVSSVLLSEYAKKVFTFDVVIRPAVKTLHNALGIKNIFPMKVETLEQEQNDIANIFAENDVTFCFVDGDHTGDGPSLDLAMVSGCKYILCHDYDIGSAPAVTNAVNAMADKGWKKDVFLNGWFALLTRD